MQELDIQGKKVAVFGLGDQVSYSENYADAAGELHDVFENLGCQMYGYTSMEGYENEDSKSIRGDKFCGLLCDMVNQEELTPERVENWVAQLRAEGFLEGGTVQSSTSSASVSIPAQGKPEAMLETIQEHSDMLEETIKAHGSSGYIPHYNGMTKSTMWVSCNNVPFYLVVVVVVVVLLTDKHGSFIDSTGRYLPMDALVTTQLMSSHRRFSCKNTNPCVVKNSTTCCIMSFRVKVECCLHYYRPSPYGFHLDMVGKSCISPSKNGK
jgi:hypothetical protein